MPAKAPYNFVPLNDTVYFSDQGKLKNRNVHDSYLEKTNSGYINLTIETLTPLFIRGKGNDFLKVDDKPIIPGSSIRGLCREMVEIMSFSHLYYVQDSAIFKRRVYQEGHPSPGILRYEDGEFLIYPADCQQIGQRGESPFYYNFSDDEVEFTTGQFGRGTIREWRVFAVVSDEPLLVPKTVLNSYKDEDITRGEEVPNVFECAKRKRVKGEIIPEKFGMPIFYTLDDNEEIDSISHCKLGRMPYKKRLHKHIPKVILQDEKEDRDLDLVEAIFGSTKTATRVCFEDAFLAANQNDIYLGTDIQPKILSSPKPTSYQLYLEPGSNRRAQDWNSNANIRGHKMYWHRNTPSNGSQYSWKEPENATATGSHSSAICPIRPKVIFNARIRFDNLSELELGCLLTALQLPENCAHKMGMAKPLGLGSIKIEVELSMINRASRYQKLFEEGTFHPALTIKTKQDIEGLQERFQKLLLAGIKKTGTNYWELPRLNELKTMLKWDDDFNSKNDWLEKTRYMEIEHGKNKQNPRGINEYKNRDVLPNPSQVNRR
jgi:hypothetical protein